MDSLRVQATLRRQLMEKCVLRPIIVILCITSNEREKCVAASLHQLGLRSMCVGTNANENILGAVLLYIDAKSLPRIESL